MANRRDDDDNGRRPGRDVAVVHPPRLPYPAAAAAAAGIDASRWKALTDAIFPAAKTVDGVMLAIAYAKARNLDIFKRVVHVVPMWNSTLGQEVDTVWPGIGELRTTASRTTAWAGNDECIFGPPQTKGFEDKRERQARGNAPATAMREACDPFTWPEWAQITVYKMVQGVRCAFVGPKVRFTETFSGVKGLRVPNDRWRQAPYQMLEKCAEAAALRRAFPEELGDQWTAEEMEGKTLSDDAIAADYTVVDNGDGQQQQEKRRPTRERKPPWSDAVQVEIDQLQERIHNTHNPEVLENARDENLDRLKAWPPKALEELRRRFKERIDFLREGEPQREEQGGGDDRDEGDGGYTDADFKRFYDLFVRRLSEKVGNAPDLNSLHAGEKTALSQLPPDWQARAGRAFDLAMAVTRENGSSADFEERLAALPDDSGAGAAAASTD